MSARKGYGTGDWIFDSLVLEKKWGGRIRFRGKTCIVSAIRNRDRGRNFCNTVSDEDTDCACEDAVFNEWNNRTKYVTVLLYADIGKDGIGEKPFEGCRPADKDGAFNLPKQTGTVYKAGKTSP